MADKLAPLLHTGITELSDREFAQFQAWIYSSVGIKLSSGKKALVAGRLSKRLRHHQLVSYGKYFEFIMSSAQQGELQIAIDLLTTNETYFFREPKHFEFLEQHIIKSLPIRKIFRVWSAASSSGEEPYSLAMCLAEHLGSSPWEVIGSDISSKVLAQAQAGHYPMERARNLPNSLLAKYCLKGIGSQEGTLLIDRLLRERVHFLYVNLNEALPELGEFDVIFLRNVMIYFDHETKCKVVARLLPRLKPGGYFIVSHSESLNGVCDQLKLIAPSIYRKP